MVARAVGDGRVLNGLIVARIQPRRAVHCPTGAGTRAVPLIEVQPRKRWRHSWRGSHSGTARSRGSPARGMSPGPARIRPAGNAFRETPKASTDPSHSIMRACFNAVVAGHVT